MFLAKISSPVYEIKGQRWNSWPEATRAEFLSLFPEAKLDEDGGLSANWGEWLIDDVQAGWLVERGLTIQVSRLKGLTGPSRSFRELAEVQHASVSAVHVHIPNVGLLAIDEVDYQEDCCTDRLQQLLDDGWRILAVCPPNNERRPTYILGRTKERNS